MMGTGMAEGPQRAREATEAAIRNPLLEDINLQGARGILVNITAGKSLSLGEYTEVGEIIEAFTSDQATVKIGAVIDESMKDSLSVTVVATGLGYLETPEVPSATPTAHIVNTLRGEAPTAAAESNTSAPRPAPTRPTRQSTQTTRADDLDLLDIPTFLRRQSE